MTVVLMTGALDDDVAVRAREVGATKVLFKANLCRELSAAVLALS